MGAVNNGRVELSFYLGWGGGVRMYTLTSDTPVDDGEWHMVKVMRQERESSLEVDDEPIKKGTAPDGAKQLDTDGILWIGCKRDPPYGLRVTENFEGCIKEVLIAGEPLNLMKDQNRHSATVKFC